MLFDVFDVLFCVAGAADAADAACQMTTSELALLWQTCLTDLTATGSKSA
jgi:hypothetical protein